jgi:seryl-tRNA synthetase
MHDIRWIRENAEEMATGLARRGFSPDEARRQVDDLIAKDEARRAHLASLQEMQERRNYLSKEIGNAMRAKDMARAEELKAEVAEIKSVIQNGEGRERELDQVLADTLAGIPNLPLADVPVGKDEHDHVELVLAQHAARILAGRPCFRTEARRQRGEAQRLREIVED